MMDQITRRVSCIYNKSGEQQRYTPFYSSAASEGYKGQVETLRALEEGLLAYPGCAVVISHDRWFLDRIATHILAFEGNSEVVWFEGNYQEYVEDYKKRRGEDAERPHRIRYKPLTR